MESEFHTALACESEYATTSLSSFFSATSESGGGEWEAQ